MKFRIEWFLSVDLSISLGIEVCNICDKRSRNSLPVHFYFRSSLRATQEQWSIGVKVTVRRLTHELRCCQIYRNCRNETKWTRIIPSKYARSHCRTTKADHTSILIRDAIFQRSDPIIYCWRSISLLSNLNFNYSLMTFQFLRKMHTNISTEMIFIFHQHSFHYICPLSTTSKKSPKCLSRFAHCFRKRNSENLQKCYHYYADWCKLLSRMLWLS